MQKTQEITYKIIHSARRTVSLEVTSDCKVIVRAPLRMQEKDIKAFVEKHTVWITEKLELRRKKSAQNIITKEKEVYLRELAAKTLPQRVKMYSELMGVTPTGIKITSAEKRFGSCSPKNSLCFSWKLFAYPQEAVDYVIVHELAHINYKNHSKAFYAYIAEYLPDYKERIKLLKE